MVKKVKNADFLNVSVSFDKKNSFSEEISSNFDSTTMNLEEALLSEKDLVLLSLFPPAVKPKDQFGFDEKTLADIHRLLEEKNTLIYLFGNPYVLDILKLQPSSNVVLVYQGFPEFQEVAFEHFSGKIEARGKLSIQLKTFQP